MPTCTDTVDNNISYTHMYMCIHIHRQHARTGNTHAHMYTHVRMYTHVHRQTDRQTDTLTTVDYPLHLQSLVYQQLLISA